MRGQIDQQPKLIGQGKLRVTGWAKYEDDELGAVIHVTVTQGGAEGRGDSDFGNEEKWTAMVRGNFVPGPAHAAATATVHDDDGTTETYPEPPDTWEADIVIEP